MGILKLIAFVLLLFPHVALALPAFPGAEGAAAEAFGGRGGTVYTVSNLNDSGVGSFRAACEASGARIVVFSVSGWIDLTTDIEITNPNITILGQTSPGGIGVMGRTFIISASQVVVRHMRFAAGSYRADELDSLRIWGDGTSPASINDILIDHCSIRWGCDESGETAYNPGRVTLSWSVIGPGLYNCAPESNHNLGFLVWGGNDSKVSFHHNYFPHNRYRNPEVNGGGAGNAPYADIVNNVGFDSFGGYTGFHGYAGNGYVNVVHNYFKKASQNNADAREGILFNGSSPSGNASMYVVGNNGAWRTTWDDDRLGYQDWDALKTEWNGETPHISWQKLTPNSMPGIAVTVTNMDADYAATIVANSGATKPVIDAADTLYKTDFTNTTQRFLDGDVTGNETSDYPTLEGGTYPTDSDNDGMSDVWEISTFGNLTQTASGDADSDGYTNIEEYSHYLAGDTESGESDTTPPSTTPSKTGGRYLIPQSVTLTADETATIYYTTDGSTPTESSTQYSSAITVLQNVATTVLKYFAKDAAGNSSPVQTQTYRCQICR